MAADGTPAVQRTWTGIHGPPGGGVVWQKNTTGRAGSSARSEPNWASSSGGDQPGISTAR
jgi:hypothetical protein